MDKRTGQISIICFLSGYATFKAVGLVSQSFAFFLPELVLGGAALGAAIGYFGYAPRRITDSVFRSIHILSSINVHRQIVHRLNWALHPLLWLHLAIVCPFAIPFYSALNRIGVPLVLRPVFCIVGVWPLYWIHSALLFPACILSDPRIAAKWVTRLMLNRIENTQGATGIGELGNTGSMDTAAIRDLKWLLICVATPMTCKTASELYGDFAAQVMLFIGQRLWQNLTIGTVNTNCRIRALVRVSHSDLRLLCCIDGPLGGLTGYMLFHSRGTETHPIIPSSLSLLAGFISVLFGVISYELLSKRILKITAISSSITP